MVSSMFFLFYTCTGETPKIIFSDHKDVQIINPKNGEARILVSQLKSSIGVDFHYADQRIYWSDVSKDKIERIFLNGTGREVVVSQGMNSPEGIFTCSGVSK